jgi:hypothetical protein
MTDLELLHNYTAFTYISLADSPVRVISVSCTPLYFGIYPWKVTRGSSSKKLTFTITPDYARVL